MTPRFSVAIPIVKTRFLESAVESVLAQTYRDFELIMVNNGPDKDSRSEITGLMNKYKDERIRGYVNEDPLSVPGGMKIIRDWNECLDLATGEFFILFSDDDVYEKTFLESMASLTNAHPGASLFHCRAGIIDDDGKLLALSPACPERESVIDFLWHRLHGHRLQYVADFVCRRESLKGIGGFPSLPLAWGADDLAWYSIGRSGGIAYSPKVLYFWRRSNVNVSGTGDIELRFDALDSYRHWVGAFLKSLIPLNDWEKAELEQIEDACRNWCSGGKDHVFVTYAGNRSVFHRLIVFMKLRRKHALRPIILLRSILRR